MRATGATLARGRHGRGRPGIGLLVEDRYLAQAQPSGLAAALRERGHPVTVMAPERQAVDLGDPSWCAGFDVLVCRGRSAAVLALLAAAQAQGVRCVNTPEAIATVVNKATMGAALAAAGIPVPRTFLGSPRELAENPAATPPLILKPICGDNAAGLRIVRDRPHLLDLDWPGGVALAQQFLATDGTDLKLYCAGERIWAVRRPSPIDATDGTPRPGPSPSQPVPVTRSLAELARRCGAVTGLDLFGVDCAVGPDGPVVLEVNDFPNYTGADRADARLAEHVIALVRA